MIRIFIVAILAIWILGESTQTYAQSGSIVPFEPITSEQTVSGAILIHGAEGQASLNANVARVLAPDVELAGDVSVVDEPVIWASDADLAARTGSFPPDSNA